MESRERVLTALKGERPDRVPIVEWIDWTPMVALASRLNIEVPPAEERLAFEELACRLVPAIGIDSLLTYMPAVFAPVDDAHVRDRYGTVYRRSEHGEPMPIEGPIGSPEDLEHFDMVSMLLPSDFDGVRHIRARLGPDYPVVFLCSDTFQTAWMLRGAMQTLLVDYVKRPDLVHRLTRLVTDATLATVQGAADAGADVLFMEGDLAGEQSPFFSLQHFRAYVRPYYEEIVAAAHERGLPIVKHSDGNMWPFMEDLVEIGFDGFNPVQPQCMDIAEAKEKVGDRICLIGNIDCRDLLCFGTEGEVEEVVRRTIEVAGPGGGFILSSSNSIHPDVRIENFLAMLRAGFLYGSYEGNR